MRLKPLVAVSAILLFGVVGLIAPAQAISTYTYVMDDFNITRNGTLIFDDPFTDGVPPPSAPNFTNGASASYADTGTFGPEASGKLTINSSGAVAFTNPGGPLFLNHALLLQPINATLPNGIGVGTTFDVQGKFDLVVPVLSPGVKSTGYGIELNDCFAGVCGHDVLFAEVIRRANNDVVVIFGRNDFVDNTQTFYATDVLSAADLLNQQIGFDLIKADSGTNLILADYFFVNGGIKSGLTTLGTTTDIFQGEKNWTRGAFYGFERTVPLPGTLILLGSGLAALAGTTWRRHRRK